MAGCYGNHPEDRYFERMLWKYLEETYGDDDEDLEELLDEECVDEEEET